MSKLLSQSDLDLLASLDDSLDPTIKDNLVWHIEAVKKMMAYQSEIMTFQQTVKKHFPLSNLSLTFYLAFFMLKVSKFSDLAPLLQDLARQGHRRTANPIVNKGFGSITYAFGSYIHIQASINVTPKGTCRRVITGYKDVAPEPIYEVVCNDKNLELPEDQPNATDTDGPST